MSLNQNSYLSKRRKEHIKISSFVLKFCPLLNIADSMGSIVVDLVFFLLFISRKSFLIAILKNNTGGKLWAGKMSFFCSSIAHGWKFSSGTHRGPHYEPLLQKSRLLCMYLQRKHLMILFYSQKLIFFTQFLPTL